MASFSNLYNQPRFPAQPPHQAFPAPSGLPPANPDYHHILPPPNVSGPSISNVSSLTTGQAPSNQPPLSQQQRHPGTPYIGCKLNLITKSNIRYEGVLTSVDAEKGELSLSDVRTWGSEDRPVSQPVPSSPYLYNLMTFRGDGISELIIVSEAPAEMATDPAVIQVSRSSVINPSLPSQSMAYPLEQRPFVHAHQGQAQALPMGVSFPQQGSSAPLPYPPVAGPAQPYQQVPQPSVLPPGFGAPGQAAPRPGLAPPGAQLGGQGSSYLPPGAPLLPQSPAISKQSQALPPGQLIFPPAPIGQGGASPQQLPMRPPFAQVPQPIPGGQAAVVPALNFPMRAPVPAQLISQTAAAHAPDVSQQQSASSIASSQMFSASSSMANAPSGKWTQGSAAQGFAQVSQNERAALPAVAGAISQGQPQAQPSWMQHTQGFPLQTQPKASEASFPLPGTSSSASHTRMPVPLPPSNAPYATYQASAPSGTHGPHTPVLQMPAGQVVAVGAQERQRGITNATSTTETEEAEEGEYEEEEGGEGEYENADTEQKPTPGSGQQMATRQSGGPYSQGQLQLPLQNNLGRPILGQNQAIMPPPQQAQPRPSLPPSSSATAWSRIVQHGAERPGPGPYSQPRQAPAPFSSTGVPSGGGPRMSGSAGRGGHSQAYGGGEGEEDETVAVGTFAPPYPARAGGPVAGANRSFFDQISRQPARAEQQERPRQQGPRNAVPEWYGDSAQGTQSSNSNWQQQQRFVKRGQGGAQMTVTLRTSADEQPRGIGGFSTAIRGSTEGDSSVRTPITQAEQPFSLGSRQVPPNMGLGIGLGIGRGSPPPSARGARAGMRGVPAFRSPSRGSARGASREFHVHPQWAQSSGFGRGTRGGGGFRGQMPAPFGRGGFGTNSYGSGNTFGMGPFSGNQYGPSGGQQYGQYNANQTAFGPGFANRRGRPPMRANRFQTGNGRMRRNSDGDIEDLDVSQIKAAGDYDFAASNAEFESTILSSLNLADGPRKGASAGSPGRGAEILEEGEMPEGEEDHDVGTLGAVNLNLQVNVNVNTGSGAGANEEGVELGADAGGLSESKEIASANYNKGHSFFDTISREPPRDRGRGFRSRGRSRRANYF